MKTALLIQATREQRADVAVAEAFPNAGRRAIAELFAAGAVRSDGTTLRKGDFVGPGQQIELLRVPRNLDEFAVSPTEAEIDVLFENDGLLVISKPAGVACYPLRADETATIANHLVHKYPGFAGIGEDPRETGIAHRLDNGTSGALIACKSQSAWVTMRDAFSSGTIEKRYLALVEGYAESGSNHSPIAQKNRRCHADPAGLPAATEWSVKERFRSATLLSCHARTGRRHQVRVHLADRGHPIVGDTLYGAQSGHEFVGHFLHAEELKFHWRQQTIAVTAPLPADRANYLLRLRAR